MGGIRSEPLNTLAKKIWHWCMSRKIWLSAQYVPGDLNAEADSALRLFSEDLDWSLHPTIFSELQSTIRSPDIDLFASRLNFKSYLSHIGKGAQGQSCGNTNSSYLAHTGLVPSASTFSSATASTLAKVGGSASSTTQPGVPPSEVQDEASRLGCVRKSLSDKGISSQATNLICASWTTGTEKQYQAVWKKWRGWCRERNVDCLQSHVSQVLNFLADCFGEGLSYSTLNSYRSALSSTLCPRDGTTVGCDPLVSRLLKGIYNPRPPLPRYSSTWDVSVLTQNLGTLFPLNSLSLKQLILKTVSLCALCSAGRSQTLGALSISNLVQHKESIQFIVTERLKTSRPGKPSVIDTFPSVPSKPHVCPMSTVSAYITRTCNLRNPTDFRLFISFVKPHRAVSPATISRWIKKVLSDAGIDTSIFKAHSVRGASTSAAYNKGVPVENILKLANWSNESTSRRFYLRSAEPGMPESAVNVVHLVEGLNKRLI
ncbi:uncharacterized protein [Acropora muricata]|uniref:uncharacterized protein n=1 Tax=Acropora muricata TaxID=159855 RepID=UPI0034E5A738